jgi:hypothetical protein
MLMDEPMVCEYLSYARHQFRALLIAGLIPPPREHLHGKQRWSRQELDRAAERLWRLDAEQKNEPSKAHAWRILSAFEPPARRGGPKASAKPPGAA